MKNLLFSVNLSILLLVSCGKKIEETKKPTKSYSDTTEDVVTKDIDEAQREEVYNAIKGNSVTMLQPLIEDSETIDYFFKDGQTPLTLAISENSNDLFSMLINKTKNFNAKNADNLSAIHLAVNTNNFFLINLLLSKDLDVNIEDGSGISPIIYALRIPSEYIAIKLISRGAKIDARDELGLTVKQKARSLRLRKLLEIINFIDTHKSVSNKHLNNAIKSGNIKIVDYLLNNYSEYNDIIKKRNVLITAINIKDGNLRRSMLSKLLSRGANPNNLEGGITPLIHAVIKNQVLTVGTLLTYGADIFIKDDEGYSAIDYAVNYQRYNILNILNQEIRD